MALLILNNAHTQWVTDSPDWLKIAYLIILVSCFLGWVSCNTLIWEASILWANGNLVNIFFWVNPNTKYHCIPKKMTPEMLQVVSKLGIQAALICFRSGKNLESYNFHILHADSAFILQNLLAGIFMMHCIQMSG